MTKYMVLAGSSVPSCRMLKSEFYSIQVFAHFGPSKPKFFSGGLAPPALAARCARTRRPRIRDRPQKKIAADKSRFTL